HAGYRQLLQDQILGLVAAGVEAQVIERPGGIFVRRAEQISDEDRILFEAVARAVLSDQRGTLAEQVARRSVTERRLRSRGSPDAEQGARRNRPRRSAFSTAAAASAPTGASTSSPPRAAGGRRRPG